MEIKNYDLPAGLRGRAKEFLGLFSPIFLENIGLCQQSATVYFKTMPIDQFVINEASGKKCIVKPEDEIVYVGNGKWKISDSEVDAG